MAILDLVLFLFLPNNVGERVAVIGIVTFFGLMISSAHHEYAKEKDGKDEPSEVVNVSKEPVQTSRTSPTESANGKKDGGGTEDKEIMRTSIAGTLIVIYIIILASSIFTNPTLSDKDTVFKTTFDNFGNVIIVVVGFYFGSKGAIQIYRIYRATKKDDGQNGKEGEENQQSKPPTPTGDAATKGKSK